MVRFDSTREQEPDQLADIHELCVIEARNYVSYDVTYNLSHIRLQKIIML